MLLLIRYARVPPFILDEHLGTYASPAAPALQQETARRLGFQDLRCRDSEGKQ
jgi:hypothetical protein